MFIKHKITGQIIDTDKPDDYIKSGSWAMLPDEKNRWGVWRIFKNPTDANERGKKRPTEKRDSRSNGNQS